MLYRKARLGWSTGPSGYWASELSKTPGTAAGSNLAISPNGKLWYVRYNDDDAYIAEIITRDVYDFGDVAQSQLVILPSGSYEAKCDCVATNDYVYAIYQNSSTASSVIKHSTTNLSITWQYDTNSTEPEGRQAVAIDSSENVYYVSGTTDLINKSTSAGSASWRYQYTGGNNSFWPSVCTPDASVYALIDNTNAGRQEIHVIKIDPTTPAIDWQQLAYLGSGSFDPPNHQIYTDSSGNVFAALSTLGTKQVYLMKWNSSGTFQWGRQLSSANNSSIGGVVSDSDGNIYVMVNDSDDDAIQVVKLNTSGTTLWKKRITTPDGVTIFHGKRLLVDNTNDFLYVHASGGAAVFTHDYILCLSVEDEVDYGQALGMTIDGTSIFTVAAASGITTGSGVMGISADSTSWTSDTNTLSSGSGWLTTDRELI